METKVKNKTADTGKQMIKANAELSTTEDKTLQQSVIAITQENSTDLLVKVQKFQGLANKEPDRAGIKKTPDNRGEYLVISFIETLLDELFFGQWSTENFKWSVLTNEVQGSLDLVVVHPITGREIRRTGAGSIVIQVDKVPDSVTGIEKNRWALNPDNKKSNALDLGFPKLKVECLKNAAKSLGKAFGRDLNRDLVDSYNPLVKGDLSIKLPQETFERLLAEANNGKADEVLKIVTEIDFDPAQQQELINAINSKKQ